MSGVFASKESQKQFIKGALKAMGKLCLTTIINTNTVHTILASCQESLSMVNLVDQQSVHDLPKK